MLDIDEVQTEELSVFQLMQLIPDDIAAEKWFENIRWRDGKRCPKCDCANIQEVYNRRPQPLRCRKCRYFFSVRKGTVMEGTNIGLQKWAFAIYMMVTSPKGVASTKVQKDFGLTLKTAWFLNQRLREGFANENNEPITVPDSPMSGTVEVDEAYIGGTDRWKHADKKLHGAAATMLRFYRSTDAMITTSDTEERSVEVAALAAAGTTTKEMDVTAPSSPGTYYYGACVDVVTGESDTTNNCSTSVEVTVAQPKSDLVVGEPSVDDDEPAAGASFTLSATVENEGGVAAAATTLRYYRSADATITMSDTEVVTDAIAGLAASASSSQSVELTAPSAPGTYYYGACVDAVTGESDTTNNCSSSVQVTVPEPSASEPTAPDQVAAEVAPSPSAAGAGNGEFYVHWIPSGDGGSAITKYQYRVWKTGQTAPATWTDISLSDSALYTQDGKTVFNATGTGITTFDHRDRALPSGYTVELRAVNTVGPGTAAAATLTPATYWFEIEPLSWDQGSIDTYPVLVYEGTAVRFRLHIKHDIPNGHVVQANNGFDEPFTLGLAITDTDNALAGSPPSSVLFAGNDTSEDVTLQVAEDDVGADDKEVTLALSSTMTSPSNVFLGRFPPSVPFIVYDNEGPPSTPTNLTASPGDGQVTLTWTTPAESVASTKHQYCRRTDSAACTVLNWRDIPNSGTGETNANSYTVTRLQNGTDYTFRVRAVHAGGKSGVSNEATATPQVPEPAPDLVVATPTVSDSGSGRRGDVHAVGDGNE